MATGPSGCETRGRRSATRSRRPSLARSLCWRSPTRDVTPLTATAPRWTSPATPASSSSGMAATSWPTRSPAADHCGPGHRAARRRRLGDRAATRRCLLTGWHSGHQLAHLGWDIALAAGAPSSPRGRPDGAPSSAPSGWTRGAELVPGTRRDDALQCPGPRRVVVLDHPLDTDAGRGSPRPSTGRTVRPGRTARRAAAASYRRHPYVCSIYPIAPDDCRRPGAAVRSRSRVASQDRWHLSGVLGSRGSAAAAADLFAARGRTPRPAPAASGTGGVRLGWPGVARPVRVPAPRPRTRRWRRCMPNIGQFVRGHEGHGPTRLLSAGDPAVLPPVPAGHYALHGQIEDLPDGPSRRWTHLTVSRRAAPCRPTRSSRPSRRPTRGRLRATACRRSSSSAARCRGSASPSSASDGIAVAGARRHRRGRGALSAATPVEECVTPGTCLGPRTQRRRHRRLPGGHPDGRGQQASSRRRRTCALLAHVREVDVNDTELMGGDDDGFLAVVIANRLPQPASTDQGRPMPSEVPRLPDQHRGPARHAAAAPPRRRPRHSRPTQLVQDLRALAATRRRHPTSS